jgi:hypothetical protein
MAEPNKAETELQERLASCEACDDSYQALSVPLAVARDVLAEIARLRAVVEFAGKEAQSLTVWCPTCAEFQHVADMDYPALRCSKCVDVVGCYDFDTPNPTTGAE